ncbi:OLC1v1037174C1 [Oldenlandia corymbosa var. corymbosa]|uniref:RBR-type E3 ubiquitin transferase n=1 Tax=Oldenlandia corymbosa var. corymbosa TaxID=529605 RepID=A0AAV1CZQ4_OLDCO|nr:OLC1v1037174C1 [Oldenlandia corymbosa var. corymbosa]
MGSKRNNTCGICLEKMEIRRMSSLHDCTHNHCTTCLRKLAEVKLSEEGTLPTCPQEGCKSSIKIGNCKKILTPRLVALMEERLKESEIPVLNRIYCPFPKCSHLMSKSAALYYTEFMVAPKNKNDVDSGFRKCLKCGNGFCVNCKVPWHKDTTCSDYKLLHPHSSAEEALLISLARRYSWRRCIECSHMIEISAGCYHIKCRCGCQFCYACGMEWQKDEKPCGCPAWNERLIVY